MKRVGGKVTKIDDFFARKSKSSKGKALPKWKMQVPKTNRWRPHATEFSWAILCLHYNIAIQMQTTKSFVYIVLLCF